MTIDTRALLIGRLEEDLIGPDAPDEILTDLPLDRYLTGILYPQRTELAARDVDDTGAETAGDDWDDQGSDSPISNLNLRKPATIGLSFRIRPRTGERRPVTLAVEIDGGRYERCRHPEILREVDTANGRKGRTLRPAWHRVPVHARYAVEIGATGATRVSLLGGADGRRDPEGVERDVRWLASLQVYTVAVGNGNEWVVTVALVNNHDAGQDKERRQDELALFQASVRVTRPQEWDFSARPPTTTSYDEDARIAALIFRDVQEYAVGHTCSAKWHRSRDGLVEALETTWLPVVDVPLVSADGGPHLVRRIRLVAPDGLRASVLAEADDSEVWSILQAIPEGYADWIVDCKTRIDGAPEAGAEHADERPPIPPHLRAQARAHLAACRRAERRMRAGIETLRRDSNARAAFRLMNQAMALQRSWTERGRPLSWRPFQLAFILQNLRSLTNRHSPDRQIMDLLWFPTGGGKTEAYLGLIAYVLFLRRIRADEPGKGGGVACLMRYTLRLLTLQQFERASTLTLACEYLRRGEPPRGLPDLRASAPISIGLWVGGSATPNSISEAIEALSSSFAPSTPKQLASCPCCRAPLRWTPTDGSSGVRVFCTTGGECDLARRIGDYPVLTVDELIYLQPPSLLIGTVDKFAQLVRKAETRSLFRAGGSPPPDLVIQDELHLISGPLGSLAGMYEAAIDHLTLHEGSPAKVVGSTATIRRAQDQVRALFDRQVAQFPPPGLDAADSCFAMVPRDAPVRRYVGLTTAGRSAKFTLQAAYGSLLQGATTLPEGRRDGYHTVVGYFNALRELGGALPLVQDDVLASIDLFARRRLETPRSVHSVVELTSRVSQTDIGDILGRLQRTMNEEDPVDVLLATNMISVGVDVSRLGLMVVMGQPKTASEYIQATSRVGRDTHMPGLVLAVLNSNKTRDRSHFETFASWHSALYRGVEATSVTPFASRARDKALHGALVLMARHLIPGLENAPGLSSANVKALQAMAECLANRIARVDKAEEEAAREELEEIITLWKDRSQIVTQYWNDHNIRTSLLVGAEMAAARNLASRSAAHSWPTLNAMRNVEPTTQIKLVENLAHAT